MSILDWLHDNADANKVETGDLSDHSIAVIGMAVRLPGANNLSEAWQIIQHGDDCIAGFPEARKADIEHYQAKVGSDRQEFLPGAYLDEIDKFDSRFFRITGREASLMDPNQRIFLETAWSALEDAGYGSNALANSRTGVYVGHSDSITYQSMIAELAPDLLPVSVAGNIKSVIASRIAYILDLKGPSMLVDTACSSSLVAVHLACQALRNNECSMALAGGIRIQLTPVRSPVKLGVESSDGKTRTFDNQSDGTGIGEGAVAVLLKPLSDARRDGDNIHAVIRGSAVNQDGASVGITAPNVLAQEDVLCRAWRNAGIDPDTIEYVEAHGTGTRLGDPIEIEALTSAFRRHTDKRQLCGVGSIKANLGHLDSAAGIVGLMKAVLMLKHRYLPPLLHFHYPNEHIQVEDSPIYICDTGCGWHTYHPVRRCGVSAFGLSGTNCHIVLEEAVPAVRLNADAQFKLPFLVSTMSKKGLVELCRNIRSELSKQNDWTYQDVCYTMAVGRNHHSFRLSFIVGSCEELISKLAMVETNSLNDENSGFFFTKHAFVQQYLESAEMDDINKQEKADIDSRLVSLIKSLNNGSGNCLPEICALYAAGADGDWGLLYPDGCRRISLPTYPFQRKRCWLDIPAAINQEEQKVPNRGLHPLIDSLIVESVSQDIYQTIFSLEKHWVVSEHRIFGQHFPPGTTFLEMARVAAEQYYPGKLLSIQQIFYFQPLVVEENKARKVQTIIERQNNGIKFSIVSSNDSNKRPDRSWVTHAEGIVIPIEAGSAPRMDVKKVKARCKQPLSENMHLFGSTRTGEDERFYFGQRYRSIQKDIAVGNGELFAHLTMDNAFVADLNEYDIHPFLLDVALIPFGDDFGDSVYLPFSIKCFNIYGKLPKEFLCYCRAAEKSTASGETKTFDVTLCTQDGSILGEIINYTVKRVNKPGLMEAKNAPYMYIYVWQCISSQAENVHKSECLLLIRNGSNWCKSLMEDIKMRCGRVIDVLLGTEYRNLGNDCYTVGNTEAGFSTLIENLNDIEFDTVVHMCALTDDAPESDDGIQELESGVFSAFRTIKAIANGRHLKNKVDIVLLADCAYEVIGSEEKLHPLHATLAGFSTVVEMEHALLRCRYIDVDRVSSINAVVNQIFTPSQQKGALREGRLFTPTLKQFNLHSAQEGYLPIEEGKTYVITGGAGAIGLSIAKYISSICSASIALIGRSPVAPAVDAWMQGAPELKPRISYYQADVSDREQLNHVLTEIRTEHGSIEGVIHAAGIPGKGLMYQKTESTFRNVLSAKIMGTRNLDDLTRQDNLKFFVVFSSITGLIGGIGQVDYAAANAFLDAFAYQRNRTHKHTVSLDWAAWMDIGMAWENGVRDDGVFHLLPPKKAIELFVCALKSNEAQLIIGQINPDKAVDLSNSYYLTAEGIADAGVLRKTAVPSIAKKAADSRDTKTKVAMIWAEVLGDDDIEVDADFYSLGGDSIIAVELLKAIDNEFPGFLDITDIFSYPSIAQMSAMIDEKISLDKIQSGKLNTAVTNDADTDLDKLLEKLTEGHITPDEAEKLWS